jgi:periplasmic protein TonB
LCSNRSLTLALLFSLLAHAILISGFDDFARLTAEGAQNAEMQPGSLAAFLRPTPDALTPNPAPVVAAKPETPPKRRPSAPTETFSQPSSQDESALPSQVGVLSPETVSGPPAATAALMPANQGSVDAATSSVSATMHADGVRQYRINLGREAKRYRRYPVLARERGWEGEVLVVVTTVAGVSEPRVSLSRSSGRAVLDNEALAMLQQAVRTAQVPEALANRPFALDMPVRFSLEE